MPSSSVLPSDETAARYDAFISYSHAKDKPVGAALQSAMQKLGKPWYRRRALRIFRDDTSLAATPELWPTLEKTLLQSRYLIVLASPQFARSKWCGMEVAHWLAHKSLDTLLVAVTDGDLRWDSAASDFIWDDATPLPPVLKGHFRNEPKWIDLRPWRDAPNARDAKFMDAAADLAAVLHGLPKEDLLSQEVRQQKRALRLAWSAAASLTLLTAGAGWQWWEAETAKWAAERNMEAARNAAEDLVFKIADGLRGVEGMRVESVRRILDTAKVVIDDLARTAPRDLRLQNSRASMLHAFADTLLEAGDTAGARERAEEALAIRRMLADIYPDHTGLRFNIGNVLVTTGDIRVAEGDGKGALQAYEAGLGTVRAILATNRFNAEWLAVEAGLLGRVGAVKRNAGDRQGAFHAFDLALDITRRIAAIAPGHARASGRDMSVALSNIASIRLDMHDRPGALAAYEESLAIMRKVAASDPGNAGWQFDVSVTLVRAGDIRAVLDDHAGAKAAHEEALALRRAAVAVDPGNVMWRRSLAISLYRVGDFKRDDGDRAAATAAYDESLAISRKLAAVDPANATFLSDAGAVLYRLGEVRHGAGDDAGASAAFEESAAAFRKLMAADSSNTDHQRNLSLGLTRLADLHLAAGAVAEALRAYEEDLPIRQKLARADLLNAALQHETSLHLVKVGDLRRKAGNAAGALALYGGSLSLLRELITAHEEDRLRAPDVPPGGPGLATLLADMVASLQRLAMVTERPKAIAAVQQAIDFLADVGKAGVSTSPHQAWRAELDALLARLSRESATTATSASSAAPSLDPAP